MHDTCICRKQRAKTQHPLADFMHTLKMVNRRRSPEGVKCRNKAGIAGACTGTCTGRALGVRNEVLHHVGRYFYCAVTVLLMYIIWNVIYVHVHILLNDIGNTLSISFIFRASKTYLHFPRLQSHSWGLYILCEECFCIMIQMETECKVLTKWARAYILGLDGSDVLWWYRMNEIELYTLYDICLCICLECGAWEVAEGENKKRQLTDSRVYIG